MEARLNKTTAYLVAAAFAVSTSSAFAAKHMASEKDGAKKPTASECKKDPKMMGCEDGMTKKGLGTKAPESMPPGGTAPAATPGGIPKGDKK